jgi:hypothetical protein
VAAEKLVLANKAFKCYSQAGKCHVCIDTRSMSRSLIESLVFSHAIFLFGRHVLQTESHPVDAVAAYQSSLLTDMGRLTQERAPLVDYCICRKENSKSETDSIASSDRALE